MKKAISVILNILSIISAVVLVVLAAFCVYDWITISQTPYANTVEFWLVIDFYAVGMLITSLVGAAAAIPNIFVAMGSKTKKTAKIFTLVYSITTVVSFVLYLLPIYF